MFIRDVLIDGRLFATHEVMTIEHNYDSNVTLVGVVSRTDAFDPADIMTNHQHDLDETLTRSEAEEWVKGLAYFAEHHSEEQTMLDYISGFLTDEQAEQIPNAYPLWYAGVSYSVGNRVRQDGKLWKCLTAHVSQVGWEPCFSPSLWARNIPEDAILPWEQPDSTNPYMTGDKVLWNGVVYESVIDNNIWSPEAYPDGWRVVS